MKTDLKTKVKIKKKLNYWKTTIYFDQLKSFLVIGAILNKTCRDKILIIIR